MRRFRKILLWLIATVLLLLLIGGVAGVLVLRSGWFQEKVRARILEELTHATGGQVELGRFDFDWQGMVAKVGPLVIHGKESATEPPFLRVAAVSLGLKVISALERNVDLASLNIDHPEVHVVVYADGSTNLPSPGGATSSGGNWAEQLVNAHIRRYEITSGIFELDQRRIPLNLAGEDLHVILNYRAANPAYEGELTSRRFRISRVSKSPIEVGIASNFVLDKDGFRIPKLDVTTAESVAHLRGTLADVRTPHGEFAVDAEVAIKEVVRAFPLPIGPRGKARFEGKMQIDFGTPFGFGMQGHAVAQGVSYARDRLRIENGAVAALSAAAP